MPKTDVDYSNTIIYKIFCKDESITDVYVGHTTNFIQRKYAHKTGCNNLNNKIKIYNTIRCNGGWDNWDMIEIAKYDCKDSTEARIKEQEHYDILKATLNSCSPYSVTKKYFCKICNTNCVGPTEYNKHMNCKKQFKLNDNLETNDPESQKNGKNGICGKIDTLKYRCENCQYNCSKKYNWERHVSSSKHIKMAKINDLATKNWQKEQGMLFSCENCGKEYRDRTGLWRHKKICINHTENIIDKKDEIIDKLLKQNSELIKEQTDIKNLILEIVKNGTHNTTTHTNSHNNKAFNLNFFLNETCKNAMNITEFVDSIKLQLSDLMEVGELGYVEGISKIIVKNLNNLDETVRPVHCTDKKRETMYIKDQGQWEKEDGNKTKLKKAITKIADKNIKLLPQFREKYPDYGNSYSKISDVYNKMVIEVMETEDDKKEKIIKNISKATTIKENN